MNNGINQGPGPYNYGGQPGPYYPPTPPQAPKPPKTKVPLWAKIVIGVLAVPVVLIGGISAIVAAGGSATKVATAPVSTYDPGIYTPEPKATNTEAPVAPKTHKPAPTTTKPAPTKTAPRMTASQEQAIGSAEDYLDFKGFSRAGLIEQLSSQYGENFSKADAIYAVDHIEVDWNEQAARVAASYLAIQHFSRRGLIEQLSSEYGEQFTRAQAVYGADAVGLK